MQHSLPTSRFSIFGTAQLKAISRRSTNWDSASPESRVSLHGLIHDTESRSSYRASSPSSHLENSSDRTPRPTSPLQQSWESNTNSRRSSSVLHPAGCSDDLETLSDNQSIGEGNGEPVTHVPSLQAQWIDIGMQRPSADYEKEAYKTQDMVNSEPRSSEETMKEVQSEEKPFQGLADYPLNLGKSRKLIDDDYLQTAFGITMSRRDSEDAPQRERFSDVPPLPSSEEIASPRSEISDMFEMEVPLGLDEAIRPELEQSGTIPPLSSMPVVDQRAANDSDDMAGTDSSSSTLKQARLAEHLRGNSATAVALVSPDQVLESPKPRRPFSTVSIEGMTGTQVKKAPPEIPVKSANSLSSAETSGQDGKSSDHSPRSSMSSVASAKGLAKPNEAAPVSAPRERVRRDQETLAARYDITSMYHQSIAPSRESRSAQSMKETQESQQVRRQTSDTSMRSNSNASAANVNKPLPPEPGRSRRLSHISEQSSTPSRASSITIRQSHYTVRSKTSDDAIAKSPSSSNLDSRMSMLSGFSLRSKYTPKDLDSLDDAFQRREPPRKASQRHMNSYQASSSVNDLSLISSIKPGASYEHSLQNWQSTSRQGSISREKIPPLPTRQPSTRSQHERTASDPAATPAGSRKNNLVDLMAEKPSARPKAKGRSQSTNHISAQAKVAAERAPQRSATIVVGGSSNKAHRVLGKAVGEPSIIEDPREKNWSTHESPEPLEVTPSSSRSGADSPGYERAQDTHFEEIRRRMELLSPKDDPSSTFMSIHERNLQAGGGLGPDVPPRRVHKPTLPTHVEQPEIAHIAELDASVQERERGPHRQPDPYLVELEGSNPTVVAELPLPSPNPPQSRARGNFIPPPPPPPPAGEPFPAIAERRGRNDTLDVPSYSSRGDSITSQRSNKARSIASLVASEIPDIYAGLPSNASSSQRPSMNGEDSEQMISADAAERVLYRILQSLDSFSDLFAAATVSRGFYRTYKHHERPLLRRVLWQMSPAAWELREIDSPRSRSLGSGVNHKRHHYFTDYSQDAWILVKLKAQILEHCQSFLRADTIQALSGGGHASSQIDEALWRIWTFCKIFGCGTGGEQDIIGQMDWLKGGKLAKQSASTKTMVLTDDMMRNSVLYNPPPGFAEGNGDGLSADEIYDMTEIWTCLGVLVRGYHEKREQARKHGIFDQFNIPSGDVKKENAILEEWTHYLLSKGPHVILKVTSPSSSDQETFSRVSSQGFAEWTPPPEGSSRSTFLKEALSRVYDEQMQKTRPLMAGSPRGFSDLPQVVSPHGSGAPSPGPADSRQRIMAHRAELRAKKEDPSYKDVPVAEERPMSNFQEVLARLENINTSAAASAPPIPKIQKLTSRVTRKGKVVEPLDEQAKLIEEASISPNTLASPTSASPITPKTGKTTRLAEFRNKVTGKRQGGGNGKLGLGADKIKASQTSLNSFASKNSVDAASVSTRSTVLSQDSMDQREEVYAPMVEKLVTFGFGEGRARNALESNTHGNFIDFQQALTDLVKRREHKLKMERLARMG